MTAQLDLWQGELDAQPWGGQSLRALTRVANSFIFKAKPPKDERFFIDPEQLELFVIDTKVSPRIWGGTPSLLPLSKQLEEDS